VEGGIGHKNLVFSTVGDRRVFERLPQSTVKPALALSLHTTDHDLRRRLLPKAADIAPAELVELGEAYARRTGYPIQYQWTLLEGINDSDAELDGIARLLAGKYAVMNLDSLQQRRGCRRLRLPPPELGAGGRDGAQPASARRAHQAAPLCGAGCGGRVRTVAGAGAGRGSRFLAAGLP